MDLKLAKCNPHFFFLHHPDAPPNDPSHEALQESLKSLRYYWGSRLILECLMCLPPYVIIKRTLLFNCLQARSFPFSQREQFDEAMNKLIAKGFLKAICKRSTMSVSSYWMDGPQHFCLQLGYDQLRCFIHYSPAPSDEPEILYGKNYPIKIHQDRYKHPIIHDIKDVKVLLLGKWHRSLPLSQHIEVADPDLFYKGMERLTELKFISLRGISMIPELPQFITKLKKLQFLDCKSCHDLEVIPKNINKLWKTLTHLDLSECHLLDQMPITLSDLLHLQVLKGFHIGEPTNLRKSCTLQNLTKLSKLQKLLIYTSVKGFPNTSHLTDLQKFRSLRNLTISWRACQESTTSSTTMQRSLTGGGDQQQFSFELEKLDLRCVPSTVKCDWLNPVVFKGLKKFYITGGSFYDLGKKWDEPKEETTSVIAEENQWTVEILRLKHLRDVKMDNSELNNFFPKLCTFEKVDCPNVTSFCCDNYGIWVKRTH